jgi:integrase
MPRGIQTAECLTDRRIRHLRPPKGERIELWDTHVRGFGIRATDTTKSFSIMYRLAGRQRRMTLGTYPVLSLAEARRMAGDALLKVRLKIDPQDERDARERRLQESRENGFTAVAKQFLETYVRKRKQLRTADEIEAMLEADVLPSWGARPIESITKGDVRTLLRKIANRGAEHRANKYLAVVRKLFNWALEQDLVAVSPCLGVRPIVDEVERDRVLSDAELRLICAGCDSLGYPFGPLFQVLLLTGQRRGETAAMCWSEVDFDRKVWTIPADKAKSQRLHVVPLPPGVVERLKGMDRKDGVDLIFTTTGKTPVSGFSKAKAELDSLILADLRKQAEEHGDDLAIVRPLPEWRLHDLRRTMSTNLARLKVPRLHISKILNHADGGVTAIYDRFAYADEKRQALEVWGRFVDSILTSQSANVVPLRTASSS